MNQSNQGILILKARKMLDSLLSRLQPGERLPSARSLAQQWGGSKSTIQRAIQDKINDGTLQSVRGGGVFIKGAHEKVQAGARKTVGENIADEVYRLICEGFYTRGETLPQIKRIAIQYGVSPGSVISAYRILCRRGDVTKVGKHYIVGPFAGGLGPAGHGNVFIFDSNPESFRGRFQNSPLSSVYQTMELYLLKSGFNLRYALFKDFVKYCKQWIQNGKIPHGVIFPLDNQEQFDRIQPEIKNLRFHSLASLPRVLIASRKPIHKKLSNVFLISEGNINTTFHRRIARFINEGRYSNVSYFIDISKKGKTLPYYLKLRTELKHLNPNISVRIYVRPDKNNMNIEKMFTHSGDMDKELYNPILDKYTHTSIETLRNEITMEKEFEFHRNRLSKGSIWVFSHDKDAALALEWARGAGINVPETLSIMGLSNEPQYFHLGITSAIRDSQTIGYLCAHALIGDFPVARTTKGYIRPEAHVLNRLTTV